MKFNIFDFLLPRETKFFHYMLDHANCFAEASVLFRDLLANLETMKEDEKKLLLLSIKECESRGDSIEKKMIDELNQTFITPIDREDIHTLAIKLDRAIDILNNLAKKIDIYKINKVPSNANKFADIIIAIGQLMVLLIKELENKRNVEQIQVKMHFLENEADDLFHTSIAELFSLKHAPIDIIRYKELYEHLESIVDAVDYVGKIIRGIKVKQA
ncbi:MAG: DUF47 family protein [Candidatus Margulisbacteria bacterium]|nr:DUF47 family protein [Candidatus Margulisiibacteriota bacterium]